jgi:hypothetical protein
VANAAEDDVLHVPRHAVEEVPSKKPVCLHVSQFRFDGGSPRGSLLA